MLTLSILDPRWLRLRNSLRSTEHERDCGRKRFPFGCAHILSQTLAIFFPYLFLFHRDRWTQGSRETDRETDTEGEREREGRIEKNNRMKVSSIDWANIHHQLHTHTQGWKTQTDRQGDGGRRRREKPGRIFDLSLRQQLFIRLGFVLN